MKWNESDYPVLTVGDLLNVTEEPPNNGGNTGVAVGDPHVKPIFGEVYELPDKVANYRMVEGENLIINAGTRYFTETEKQAIRDYYVKQTGDTTRVNHLITDGVVQNRVYVQCDDVTFTYNFDNQTINSNKKVEYTINYRKDGKGIVFAFDSASHGTVKVECRHYINPQVFSGVMTNIQRNATECVGLLVRNYNASAFEVESLKNTESKQDIAKDALEVSALRTKLVKL